MEQNTKLEIRLQTLLLQISKKTEKYSEINEDMSNTSNYKNNTFAVELHSVSADTKVR